MPFPYKHSLLLLQQLIFPKQSLQEGKRFTIFVLSVMRQRQKQTAYSQCQPGEALQIIPYQGTVDKFGNISF